MQSCSVPRSKSNCLHSRHFPIPVCSHVWWLGAWYMLVTCDCLPGIKGKEACESGDFFELTMTFKYIWRCKYEFSKQVFFTVLSSYLIILITDLKDIYQKVVGSQILWTLHEQNKLKDCLHEKIEDHVTEKLQASARSSLWNKDRRGGAYAHIGWFLT